MAFFFSSKVLKKSFKYSTEKCQRPTYKKGVCLLGRKEEAVVGRWFQGGWIKCVPLFKDSGSQISLCWRSYTCKEGDT